MLFLFQTSLQLGSGSAVLALTPKIIGKACEKLDERKRFMDSICPLGFYYQK